jgi:voltage-gated potassium channel
MREKLYKIVFESDTPAGRAFDVGLIILIVLSVFTVTLDSVQIVRAQYGFWLQVAEWAFTLLFTAEYFLRLYLAPEKRKYATSFFGVVDLLAILPTYISLLFPAGRFLLTIRILRVVRIFRVLKLAHYVGEAGVLARALQQSRYKITVFLLVVLSIVVIVGSLMYLLEGPTHGFTSIPESMYWAVVTLTTVGYGDLAPQSPLGKLLASLLMITGYGIIAVPTGIVTVELGRAAGASSSARQCEECFARGHERDANFCKFCGGPLGKS